MELDDLRKKIDAIDAEIVKLLNERYEAVMRIGRWKKDRTSAVYVPSREKAVLDHLYSLNQGPMSKETLRAIYQEIMSGALSLEHFFRVAYPGPEFGETYHAAGSKFGHSVRYIVEPDDDPDSVFADIACHHADYGCVSADGPTDGGVGQAWELFMKWPDVVICAEIHTVRNRRFLILGGEKNVSSLPTGADKTTVCFSFRGEWNDALLPLRHAGCNPSLIGARPWADNEYLFFVDIPGHKDDPAVHAALAELGKQTTSMRILGSYPKSNDNPES